MRVLLLGANGFIGAHLAARLLAAGHAVVGVGRRPPMATGFAEWLRLDLRRATSTADWRSAVVGIDAVVNCAGVLQDGPRDSTRAVHAEAPAALYAACEAAGVRRVIHVSATGVERGAVSAFSATKAEAERRLRASSLDWIILRPSVVVGRAAYGGSALFRGLAALPVAFSPPNAGPLQIVQLDDLVEGVVRLLEPGAPSRLALDVVGPERLAFDEVVAAYRRWLGWRPARKVAAPSPLLSLGYGLGDLVGRLGWRSPIRSTARREIVRGAVGDPTPWTAVTGVSPRSLGEALALAPAPVQERWFARLYLLKPIVFVAFAFFWLATAVVSMTTGFQLGEDMLRRGGLGDLSPPLVVMGALADLSTGLAIAYRPTARLGLCAALAISVFYAAAGSILTPWLWNDPLGPLLKIWPVMALNLVALAILEER
jgi:uncharacterized protein YbjT (DUF2867 family)